MSKRNKKTKKFKMDKRTKKLIKQRVKVNDALDEIFHGRCVDCDVDTFHIGESYMVHDSVWKKAGMKEYGGKLCVGCIERRLGRKLDCRDFFMIGLNIQAYMFPYAASKRLRKRLHNYRRG